MVESLSLSIICSHASEFTQYKFFDFEKWLTFSSIMIYLSPIKITLEGSDFLLNDSISRLLLKIDFKKMRENFKDIENFFLVLFHVFFCVFVIYVNVLFL